MARSRIWLRLAAPVALLATGGLTLSACSTQGTPFEDRTTRDAAIGAVVGGALGAAVDRNNPARGALIGLAVGGLSGGLIGNYLKKQAQEIDAIPDAEVKGQGESLFVAFPGDVMFDSNSRSLSPGALSRLDSLADTLKRYPDTNIIVKGHTDAQGDESYNLRLSEDRANAVKNYLISRGVPAYRITAVGFGESMPLATNSTPSGRSQNRRVEIEIQPNQQLREQQQQQQGQQGGAY